MAIDEIRFADQHLSDDPDGAPPPLREIAFTALGGAGDYEVRFRTTQGRVLTDWIPLTIGASGSAERTAPITDCPGTGTKRLRVVPEWRSPETVLTAQQIRIRCT
jgi:hypothetical protein